MSSIKDRLLENEKIIKEAKLSYSEYLRLWKIILYIVAIIVLPSNIGVSFVIVFGIFIITFLNIRFTEFILTNKRVLIKTGIIKLKSLEMLLNKIESIYVEEGIIGRITDSGSLFIKGSGGTVSSFHNIENPHNFVKAVNDQISITNSENSKKE